MDAGHAGLDGDRAPDSLRQAGYQLEHHPARLTWGEPRGESARRGPVAIPQLHAPDGAADDLLRDRVDPRTDGHGSRHQPVAGLGLRRPARRAQHRAIDREHRADPFPAVRAGYPLPARADGARGRTHPPRWWDPLAAEGSRQLDVGRPAELAD